MFEGWDYIEIYQIENCMKVFIEPKDGDYHHTRDPIFQARAMRHCLVFW